MSAILPSSAEASSFADAGTREDMAKPETFERAGLLQRAIDAVFGYDFFLSYSHSDGMAYPARLKNRLEAVGFKVQLEPMDWNALIGVFLGHRPWVEAFDHGSRRGSSLSIHDGSLNNGPSNP